jgi:hypothetical protein
MFSMTRRSLPLSILLVAGLAVALVDCSAKDDALDPSDVVEASGSSAQISRFNQMVFSPVSSQDPAEAATAVAADQWWPSSCATRTKDSTNPAVVHIHLQDCTGPFGLRKHTGDITVVFSKNPNGLLHAQATSSNMTVNGKDVSWSGDADVVVSGATRTVNYNGAWTRVNLRGETVSHTSDVTIVIDTTTKCRTSNGTAVTLVADRKIDSTIQDYKICKLADGGDGCPSGTITHTNAAADKTVTVQFDGTAEAQVTGPKGHTVGVALVCGS